MKIIYNTEKTMARINEQGALLFRTQRRYNICWWINFVSALSILLKIILHFTGNTPLSSRSATFSLIHIFLIFLLDILSKKTIPKVEDTVSLDIWFHFTIEEAQLIETRSQRTGDRVFVVLVFENKQNQILEVDIGDFECRENPEVKEETLDLEEEIVWLPTKRKN